MVCDHYWASSRQGLTRWSRNVRASVVRPILLLARPGTEFAWSGRRKCLDGT